jgi:hypothetical protein
MDTLRSDSLMHRQALEFLPWYVSRKLGPDESRQMDQHLAACAACRREADGLAALFAAQAQSIPDRPVDEGRLDALFGRIDEDEWARTQAQRKEAASDRSRRSIVASIAGWLTARPLLAVGACAALLAMIMAVPVGLREQTPGSTQEVLSSGNDGALRVTFHLTAGQDASDLNQLIEADRKSGKLSGKYRIEQRSANEFTVVLEERPAISAISTLMEEWGSAPGVTDVAIDNGPGSH